MKKTLRALIALSALTVSMPVAQMTSYAASDSYSNVRAQINGSHIAAIAVGNKTYVLWRALQTFKTPYMYLGSGKFAITGGTIQGAIYNGDTYLPWDEVAPKVTAIKLPGGGFNFTSASVNHQYHIVFQTINTSVGSPAPIMIALEDGKAGVPNQTFTIQIPGSKSATVYSNSEGIPDVTMDSGACIDAIDDITAETVSPVVTWVDPNGDTQTATASITFSSANTVTVPSVNNENVVTSVPTTTFDDGVFFKAQSENHNIMFQIDTGAFATLLPKSLADSLNLPNYGGMDLYGVGGSDSGYISEISLNIGGKEFDNIPCVVSKTYQGPPLFGYEFFAHSGYDLLVSQKDNTLTILK